MKVYKSIYKYTTVSSDDLDPLQVCLDQLNEEIPAENIISIKEHYKQGDYTLEKHRPKGYYPETVTLEVYFRGE